MALQTRRYKSNAYEVGRLASFVPTAVIGTIVSSDSYKYVDISVDTTEAADLDICMAAQGFVFIVATPTQALPDLVLVSPDGKFWALSVNNSGVLAVTAFTET